MKLILCFLLSILVLACNPGFHKQKYTNFGHGKISALKTAPDSLTEPRRSTLGNQVNHDQEKIFLLPEKQIEHLAEAADLLPDSIFPFEEADVAAANHFPDTFKVSRILDDSLKQVPSLADSIDAVIYTHQLKREAKRNLIIGAVEIVVGLLALFFLPYWLPVLIIHALAGLIFLLIASHKLSKANELRSDPGKYKSPVGKYKLSQDPLSNLSLFGYTFLFVSLLISLFLLPIMLSGSLIFSFLALVVLFGLVLPLGLIALILLLIAGIKGRNFVREENLQNIDHPSGSGVRVFNVINWALVATAFTAIVVSISALFEE